MKRIKWSIELLDIIASERKGKCLSKKYINTTTKLKWQCKEGHVWMATPATIISGSWCPICKGWHQTIKNMQSLAKKKGGKCLSDKYINQHIKLKWQCKEGHVWEAKPLAIKAGTWCPFCSGRNKTIKDMQKIAKEKGGKCLSKEYINNHTKLKWQCKKGHIWEMSLKHIRKGSWCPYCSKNNIIIKGLQSLAKKKGGKLLSEKYKNSYTKLKWQCKEGHIWKATSSNIKTGRWCPICSRIKLTIKDMQKLAKQKGGKCLSKEYINNHTKLKWQCSKGHIWYSRPVNIKQSRWCPVCARYILTIEEMHKLAKEREGKCLSKKYVNQRTKLKWQCKEGHIWLAQPKNIKQGSWCPVCARYKKSEVLK